MSKEVSKPEAITLAQTLSEHTAQLETDARSLYEKSRLKAQSWKHLLTPAIRYEQRLPSVLIKAGWLYSIVTMDCDPAGYMPPRNAKDEYKKVLRAYGIGEVKGSGWRVNFREIWAERVPNAVADELGFALFQVALAYKPQAVEEKSELEAILDAMTERG